MVQSVEREPVYCGGAPMCPTKEEIAQWLWIITSTEGTKSPGGKLIYSGGKGKISGNKIQIAPEETMVIEWK